MTTGLHRHWSVHGGAVAARVLLLALLLGGGWGASARAQEGPPPGTPQADTTDAPDATGTRRVDILSADSLTGAFEGEAGVQQLIGNVRLRQELTQLSARQALRYPARGEVVLIGDVLIVEEGDSLRAHRVRYDTRRKVGRATGRVRLTDGEIEVRGPSAQYFTEEKRAVFDDDVTLIDSTHVLRSRAGEYFTEEKRAEFYHDVRLLGELEYLEADSVTYLRDEEVSIARGHVFVERLGDEEAPADTARQPFRPDAVVARLDSLWRTTVRSAVDSLAAGGALPDSLARADSLRRRRSASGRDGLAIADTTARTLLLGDYVYNDEQARTSRVEGRALLVRLEADSAGAAPDTLVLAARRMETLRTDTLEQLVAVGDVRIWQQDLAAVADSAAYLQTSRGDTAEREDTRLYRQPMAWTREGQLSGDTIRVAGRDRAVDSLLVFSSAFVAQEDTTLGRIHQMRGRDLLGLFRDDSLRYLRVRPNAEAIRFMKGEEGGANGAVQASADQAEFWLAGGELERVTFKPDIQGVQYPEESLPTALELQGFVWMPERRPLRVVLLDRPRLHRRFGQPADEAPVAAQTTPPDEAPGEGPASVPDLEGEQDP